MNSLKELDVIATPIGNLQECSHLMLDTLRQLKCLLCEDTRTTKNLLSQLGIAYDDKYFVSYHKFNEHDRLDYALNLFDKYDRIGLVSDAGYPVINDPGYNLVSACYEHGIEVKVVNGPCAAIHALVVSGIPSNTFMYLGFLERTSHKRQKQLSSYQAIPTTFIIYESVHRLPETLQDIATVFGNVTVAVTKELSKLHEHVYRMPIQELLAQPELINLRGEFVIIVDNNNPLIPGQCDDWTQDALIHDPQLKPKEKAKQLATKYNLKKAEVYDYLINLNGSKEDE